MVKKEDLCLYNQVSIISSTGRCNVRWMNNNESLKDEQDKTTIAYRLWYGPYGWGVTGNLVRFK
jgi:hypothetical protein